MTSTPNTTHLPTGAGTRLIPQRARSDARVEFRNPVPVLRSSAVDAVPILDVVVPVYNEEVDLESGIRRLHRHLNEHVPYSFRITIADNASTDRTATIAHRLAQEFAEVAVARLEQKGKGRALRQIWAASDAAVLVYMDVDLSTDLSALLPLIAPLISGHSELAIGTRLHPAARVVRGAKREFVSRSYNLLLRCTVRARFSDAACGFKAIRADAATRLLPHVQDNAWFFDTELLVLAQRAGLRIHEVPVDWVDDPGTTVHIRSTAMQDVRGVLRLLRAFARGRLVLRDIAGQLGRAGPDTALDAPHGLLRQLVRFAAVGVFSTVAYLCIYLGLRATLGPQAANAVSLLLTTVVNTALNRSFTFAAGGRGGAARHQVQGLVVLCVALAITSGSLFLVHSLDPTPRRSVEVGVLLSANAVATVVRFLLLRRWVFRR